jgi:surface polysaccharide O-acyltransferase-like enzyme
VNKLDQFSRRPVHVDLIRTIAIVGVILLHASGSWIITPQQLNQINQLESISWAFVDVCQSVARLGVPLFLMLTGMLLLQPSKIESLSVFFKKRLYRIGLPFLFWGAIYFVWDFSVKNTPFSLRDIAQGILNGPYTQFWYLYLLVGLYLLIPILRLFIAHARRNMIKYSVILWFFVASITFLFSRLSNFSLSIYVLIIAGFAGSLGLAG